MSVMTIYHKEKRNKNKEHIDFYVETLLGKNNERRRRKFTMSNSNSLQEKQTMSIYRLVKPYSNRSETPYSNQYQIDGV